MKSACTIKKHTSPRLRISPVKRPLDRMQLAECLTALGMRVNVGQNRKLTPVRRMNEWQLSDLYQAARRLWLKLVAGIHPDRGGSTAACSRLNELWTRIEFLFRQKGISA
jgi:hypothetical protein